MPKKMFHDIAIIISSSKTPIAIHLPFSAEPLAPSWYIAMKYPPNIAAEAVKGRTLEEVRKLAEVVRSMLKGEEAELDEEYEDLEALEGVRKFPVRIKCALLAWLTLIEGLKSHRSGQPTGRTVVTTEDKE